MLYTRAVSIDTIMCPVEGTALLHALCAACSSECASFKRCRGHSTMAMALSTSTKSTGNSCVDAANTPSTSHLKPTRTASGTAAISEARRSTLTMDSRAHISCTHCTKNMPDDTVLHTHCPCTTPVGADKLDKRLREDARLRVKRSTQGQHTLLGRCAGLQATGISGTTGNTPRAAIISRQNKLQNNRIRIGGRW
jgi:hypothetical protein